MKKMKRIILSFLLLLIVSLGYAQNISVNAAGPPGGGGGEPSYTWYEDYDRDGFGNAAISRPSPTKPQGYVSNKTDLDDNNQYITNVVPTQYFYLDFDVDTFGNPNSKVFYSIKPPGYVTNNLDCDDNNKPVNPNTVWYRDGDGDTFGTVSITTTSCLQPTGYVLNASDYDDGNGTITNIAPQTFYRDFDKDTFGNPNETVFCSVMPLGYVTNNADCNDTNQLINPNTIWYIDSDGDNFGSRASIVLSCTKPVGYADNPNDCNDSVTVLNPDTVWYFDFDGDGSGTDSDIVYGCYAPNKYVRRGGDCNDNNVTIFPDKIWYRDGDHDGFGVIGNIIKSCLKPEGYVDISGDCDDGNIAINPNNIWYYDGDGDEYGNSAISMQSCTQPYKYVKNSTDCDDSNPAFKQLKTWYFDNDRDGFGNNTIKIVMCEPPTDYVDNGSDYDDSTGNITNIPPRTFYEDFDKDTFGNPNVSVYYSIQRTGYVTNNSDYDDRTELITNIAPQTFYEDFDRDTFGNPNVSVYYSAQPLNWVTNNADCNDADVTLNPNTKWYADNEPDGFGDPSNFVQQCTVPSGNYVRDNTDNCPLIKGTSTDCSNLTSPSLDHNYIITKAYKERTPVSIDAASADQVQTNITYFDGLGRPEQQIANKQSPSGKDIVTHIGYDDFGRQLKEYLPYEAASANLEFVPNAENGTANFYNTLKYDNTLNPFSEKQLEASPLNRVLKQAAPGTSWVMGSGHEIKLDYQTNTADEVKVYKATVTWDAGSGLFETAFSEAGNYQPNQLYKNVTYDENTTANPSESAGSTVEFKNKEGQVVLKRTYESGIKHDTYYVYDGYGNLTYVIPPKADGNIASVLDDLCYQYKYDYRNRLVEKKLPGKQWEYIIYDKLDRPVLTQDANLRAAKKWLFTKYDAFSRPVYTGEYKNTVQVTRADMQLLADGATTLFETKQAANTINGTTVYYSNNAFPNINDTNINLFTINYYDDYNFDLNSGVSEISYGITPITETKGLATGSKIRILGKPNWITNVNYYDAKARPVYSYSKNDYLGTVSKVKTQLDFIGKTLETTAMHVRNGVTTTIVDAFTYDNAGRLTKQEQAINGAAPPEIIVVNTYDELGQLTSKKVGGKTAQGLQTVDFKYNIRGWLKNINDVNTIGTDLFAFQINYNDAADVSKRLYNGNISQTLWKTANQDTSLKNYTYSYDNLNRLTNAVDNLNKFNESLNYDKNGNITSLVRLGEIVGGVPAISNPTDFGTMDNLVYTYDAGNKLQTVSDSANDTYGFKDDFIGAGADTTTDYTYDDNGNMLTDTNKGITNITYNYLNLPTQVTIAGQNITYEYDATGVKQQKTASGIVTDYAGGFIYEGNQLKFFSQPEGYVAYNSGTFDYIYQYKDHLGNVRLSYDKNLVIQEENNYYPFGLKHKGYNNVSVLTTGSSTAQKYKFLGQERQDELGLNWDTFRYRNYDYAIGRFMGVDPITEKFYSISPYQFAHNNPVWKIELEGLEGQVTTNQDIVNREPVYMTTNIIINTTNIQSAKPQNSRPGVAMFRMGIGVENSYTKEVGNENGGVSATATAYKANVGIAVCIDGESVEYGMTVGQINADGKVGGQTVGEGQFTTFSAEGSYNIKTGEQKSNIDTFTGQVNTLGSESKQTEDLKFSFNALGAYIEANLTEAGNNLKDFANLVTSYLQGATQSYFNQNNTSNTNITPVK